MCGYLYQTPIVLTPRRGQHATNELVRPPGVIRIQSFQPPYHLIVLPRAFHSIFFIFHLIVFFIEKNVFVVVLKIAFSNTRTQAHSQAVVSLVVVLQVRRILLSFNTSSKANYGLCAETGKTAAALTNFSGFTKSTEF